MNRLFALKKIHFFFLILDGRRGGWEGEKENSNSRPVIHFQNLINDQLWAWALSQVPVTQLSYHCSVLENAMSRSWS